MQMGSEFRALKKGQESNDNEIVTLTVPEYGLTFKTYEYKPSLLEDMREADLVISHAGAGTAMEALNLGKPLVLVPNRDLMDDHQLELANKLASLQNALVTSVENFAEDLENLEKSWFKPLEPSGLPEFAKFVDQYIFGME